MARVMLNSKKLPTKLWAEAISIACDTSNLIYVRPTMGTISYEIW